LKSSEGVSRRPPTVIVVRNSGKLKVYQRKVIKVH